MPLFIDSSGVFLVFLSLTCQVHLFCLDFQTCQADLVKDGGHKYFLSVLADPYMPVSVHTNVMLCFKTSVVFVCHLKYDYKLCAVNL